MIFQLIILTTASLFSQVKCRTYIPEKYSVEHNPNNRQTYQATYNPTEQQRRTVYVDKGQYPNGWNENIMRGDRSPIIFTDKAPVTINYNGGHSGPEQSPYGFRNSCPIVLTSQGKFTVNYDGPQDDDDVPPSNRDICLLTNTMVELPSGIVMPYLKFKTISRYLPEDQKSDVRIILDNKNMTYKQFQETLRYYGCDDLENSPQPSDVDLTNYVTLANGTQVEVDDYRNIVSGITSGSETLMVPNVVSGKYSLYRSLIADELPELIPSAFVITHAGDVVPFSLYHAVDTEHFQRPSTAAVPRIRQIKWRDGKLVDVQTIRHVIDALKTPTMISFVFPNRKRLPFVQCNVKESTELYNYDPEKVMVDVGQCKNILLSHFNDILFAVRIPDDSAGDGKYKRFNPPVFAWDPAKCMNTAATNAQPDGKVCNKSNNAENGNYSGYSIHVINKDKRLADDKPADKQLTVFGPVSAMEKTTCLDSNDTIRIVLTSSTGTHEIKITNVLNNKKPLIYDITDKPVNLRDLKNVISQNECDYSPLLINKMNTTNVTNSMNPQNNNCTNILKTNTENNCEPIIKNNTENDCKPIKKNNETNCMTDIKNTSDLKDPSYLNESTQNQTVTMCNKNSTTNNNKNQTTETITTIVVTQNNTELTNTTTCNLNTSGKINNITIENGNNATKTPDCTEKCTKDQQNNCGPAVTGSNAIPITKNTDKNQTEITKTTQTNAEHAVCSNCTHTDTKSETNNAKNNTITTETKNNTTTSSPNNCRNSSNPVNGHKEVSAVNDSNQNQTETKNTTISPDCTKITSSSNTTNADKTHKPNKTNDNTVTTENRNNTITDSKNNQNSSNPISESNETPVMKNDNNQTETNNTTTINNAPINVNANTTDSNNTYTYKKPALNETVTMETKNNTTTDPKNNQNSSNAANESNTIPVTKEDNNQTETKNATATISAPNVTENTTDSNNTYAYKKPALNETVTMETKNNTTTDPKNNQNSSNAANESNTIPVTKEDNNQTETKNATATISAPNVTENTTVSNNTYAYKKPALNETVTMETKNNTTTDPKNNQNSSNAANESNTIPVTKEDNNQTETKNATATISAPNVTENTTDSNNTNAYKKPAPDGAVTMETRNNTTTDPKYNQNSSNAANESNTIPVTKEDNNQTETKNATATISAPNITENTTVSNNTYAYKKPALNETVTMETKNNTTTDPKNNQNSSNAANESNTIPVTKEDNNQTETKNATATIRTPNVTENTTDSNNTNAYKKPAPDYTDNDTVTTEIKDGTITDPNHTAVVTENPQNDSNPMVETDEIPAMTNTSDYQNLAETVNATVSTSNYVENTNASISGRTNDDTYTGSNEAPGVVNSAETIQTPETAIASDADDAGPTENPDTISETNTGVNDDESTDVYNITTTAEPTQPTPIYTEIIKTPNNGSMTNNATKIVNIIVY